MLYQPVPVRAPAERRLDRLEAAIVEAVTYADIFDWPRTTAEIQRYLPVRARLDEVEAALAARPLRALTDSIDGVVMLPGREALAGARRRRAAASASLWPQAIRYGRLIASLPFVRLVAVSGSLAIGAADEAADVDLFVVAEDGRLWLTRALVVAVVRVAATRGVRLCPNYLLAASGLALQERDRFTAHELAQLVPIAGIEAHQALLERNAWFRDFLPNHPGPPAPEWRPAARGVRRLAERVLRAGPFDRLERWEMERKVARLSAEAGADSETRFDATMCKGHVGGHRRRADEAFRRRLVEIGAVS